MSEEVMLRPECCYNHEWWEYKGNEVNNGRFDEKPQRCRLCGSYRDVQPYSDNLYDRGWVPVAK